MNLTVKSTEIMSNWYLPNNFFAVAIECTGVLVQLVPALKPHILHIKHAII